MCGNPGGNHDRASHLLTISSILNTYIDILATLPTQPLHDRPFCLLDGTTGTTLGLPRWRTVVWPLNFRFTQDRDSNSVLTIAAHMPLR